MKTTKMPRSLLAGLAFTTLIALTACNPGDLPSSTIGLPPGAGTERASIQGSIVKQQQEAARNATTVLIQRTSGTDRDVQVVRTDNDGLFRFNNVPAGEYRLAFVLQSQSERQDNEVKYYDPIKDAQSAQYFSFITTNTFNFGGNSASSYQIPQMNVGWTSNLQPHDASVDASGPVRFSWSSVEGGIGYTVDVRDSNNNPFYKSPEITSTSFNWSDLKGNQGNNNGVTARAGQTYYYLIAARLNRAASGDGPTLTYGGTALAKFTLR